MQVLLPEDVGFALAVRPHTAYRRMLCGVAPAVPCDSHPVCSAVPPRICDVQRAICATTLGFPDSTVNSCVQSAYPGRVIVTLNRRASSFTTQGVLQTGMPLNETRAPGGFDEKVTSTSPFGGAVTAAAPCGRFLRIASQASFTELPSSRVESLKIASPALLKTTILLRRRNNAFPPLWSSVIAKSALSTRFVTVTPGIFG